MQRVIKIDLLEPTAPRSRVKHSTTEPLRSRNIVDARHTVIP